MIDDIKMRVIISIGEIEIIHMSNIDNNLHKKYV